MIIYTNENCKHDEKYGTFRTPKNWHSLETWWYQMGFEFSLYIYIYIYCTTMPTKTMHPTMYKCKTHLVGNYFCKRNNLLMYIMFFLKWWFKQFKLLL
jgi:hypothetical protein